MAETKKEKVTVLVTPRPDFDGMFAAGRKFPNGISEHELTEAEIENVNAHKPYMAAHRGWKSDADAAHAEAEKRAAAEAEKQAAGEKKKTEK
jgi:hypothetical protein